MTDGIATPRDLLYTSLAAAMDAIASPAFIADADGHLWRANSAGRTKHRESRQEVLGLLSAAVKEELSSHFVSKVSTPGLPDYFLVILRDADADVDDRARSAAQHWRLTKRQAEVLSLLARGLANKSIAELLGCAERTVVVHVTAIMDKAGVDNRASIVAALAARF